MVVARHLGVGGDVTVVEERQEDAREHEEGHLHLSTGRAQGQGHDVYNVYRKQQVKTRVRHFTLELMMIKVTVQGHENHKNVYYSLEAKHVFFPFRKFGENTSLSISEKKNTIIIIIKR